MSTPSRFSASVYRIFAHHQKIGESGSKYLERGRHNLGIVAAIGSLALIGDLAVTGGDVTKAIVGAPIDLIDIENTGEVQHLEQSPPSANNPTTEVE
jgi:hypothetical protein